MRRINFVYTPKHGSWLNVAECECRSMLGSAKLVRLTMGSRGERPDLAVDREIIPIEWIFGVEQGGLRI